jgi:acyl-CoA thioester hydrolase
LAWDGKPKAADLRYTAAMSSRFSHPMPVRFADTDAQGHVFFANYLTYCDEALTAYLRAVGCPWQDLVASGVDMFYVRSECDYLGRAPFEAPLLIDTAITAFGNTSFVSAFEVRLDARPIARARLTSVCVAHGAGTPVRVPDTLREAVARFEQVT